MVSACASQLSSAFYCRLYKIFQVHTASSSKTTMQQNVFQRKFSVSIPSGTPCYRPRSGPAVALPSCHNRHNTTCRSSLNGNGNHATAEHINGHAYRVNGVVPLLDLTPDSHPQAALMDDVQSQVNAYKASSLERDRSLDDDDSTIAKFGRNQALNISHQPSSSSNGVPKRKPKYDTVMLKVSRTAIISAVAWQILHDVEATP